MREYLVDIFEENDQIEVVLELPGVDRHNITLHASSTELEVEAEGIRRIIKLPAPINEVEAKARLHNGILKITLDKAMRTVKKKVYIE